MIVRKITLLFAASILFAMSLQAQDKFNAKQLTFDPTQEGFATWSPDGKRIAFTSTRSGNFDIWLMDVDVKQLKKELRELNK